MGFIDDIRQRDTANGSEPSEGYLCGEHAISAPIFGGHRKRLTPHRKYMGNDSDVHILLLDA